jgi:DNA-binding response OmpR family regulator
MDTQPQQKNGIKVLCIEDEHFISELYARALTKAGYEVTVVIDGQEGLQEAQTDKYDVILLDIMIPNITGIEILDQLRGPDAPQLHGKIIVATNLEQGEEGRAAVEQKADGYIVKAEMTPRQLVEFLNQFNLQQEN